MAGYFGYENGSHYDVSVAVGERVLLPAVRSASPQALIIADGFSCREQVEQQTNRKAMHTAQVLQMALHEKNLSASRPYPEKKYVDGMKLRDPSAAKKALFKTACFLLLAATVAIIKYKKYTRL
ncbi:MAG TPA: hypothetical protein VHB48_17140 [Chitinophagaceae bacterium]|nr:hypothetical protein [Chitinophagaceae bacterium]